MRIENTSQKHLPAITIHLKDERMVTLTYWRPMRKKNRKEYPNDKDINGFMRWGKHTNGARKGIDSCLDWTLNLGHIDINYMDWNYNTRK